MVVFQRRSVGRVSVAVSSRAVVNDPPPLSLPVFPCVSSTALLWQRSHHPYACDPERRSCLQSSLCGERAQMSGPHSHEDKADTPNERLVASAWMMEALPCLRFLFTTFGLACCSLLFASSFLGTLAERIHGTKAGTQGGALPLRVSSIRLRRIVLVVVDTPIDLTREVTVPVAASQLEITVAIQRTKTSPLAQACISNGMATCCFPPFLPRKRQACGDANSMEVVDEGLDSRSTNP